MKATPGALSHLLPPSDISSHRHIDKYGSTHTCAQRCSFAVSSSSLQLLPTVKPVHRNIYLVRNRSQRKSNPLLMTDNVDTALRNAQLVILALAVVIIPLIVLPESHFVDITSTPKTTMLRILGTMQLGVLASRLVLALSTSEDRCLPNSPRAIKASRPTVAILISMAAVAAVSLVSTIVSILPHQSWWGRNTAGFEAGEYTALMYVILSVSTFISYREFNHSGWLWKTLLTTALIAGFIGFFQYLGLSFLDISTTHSV
jgi:hypothetical protein